jgi:putative polyhydroxyalkanoate system protein
MQVKIPHQLGRAAAKAKIVQALDDARTKIGEQATVHEERWDGDTLHFDVTAQGQRISGTLAVAEDHFDLYAKLPLMLHMFEGKIEKAIREQAGEALK